MQFVSAFVRDRKTGEYFIPGHPELGQFSVEYLESTSIVYFLGQSPDSTVEEVYTRAVKQPILNEGTGLYLESLE